MDQIHHHSFSFKCSENSIASLEFWKSKVVLDTSASDAAAASIGGGKSGAAGGGGSSSGAVPNPHLQYLAVGDVTGRLRLFQLPKNLRKKQDMREERYFIRSFFDREIARAKYAKKRSAVRAAERKAAEEAQHQIDLQNAEKLAQLQLQQQLLGGVNPTLAALGLTAAQAQASAAADGKLPADPLAGSGGGGSGQPRVGMTAKEAKALAARRKQEASDKLKEEKAAADKKRADAEEAEEREYQALHDHYKKLFSDESLTQKLTINLAAAQSNAATAAAAAAKAAAEPPQPTTRVKF